VHRAPRPSSRSARRTKLCAPSSALTRPETLTRPPHFDSSRVYIRRRWKCSRSEPLLRPGNERDARRTMRGERGSLVCLYARRENERCESRRADDRFHDRVRELLHDVGLNITLFGNFHATRKTVNSAKFQLEGSLRSLYNKLRPA